LRESEEHYINPPHTGSSEKTKFNIGGEMSPSLTPLPP
jgi:hypothetical protein